MKPVLIMFILYQVISFPQFSHYSHVTFLHCVGYYILRVAVDQTEIPSLCGPRNICAKY